MPQPPIAEDWQDFVKSQHATNGKLTHAAIQRQADAEVQRLGGPFYEREDVPSVRSIGRIISKMTPRERREYGHVRWPESFDSGLLPWEAAEATIELLRWFGGIAGQPALSDDSWRPTVRFAVAFWQVTRSAPGLPVGDRRSLAVELLRSKLGAPNPDAARGVEAKLLWGEQEAEVGELIPPQDSLGAFAEYQGLPESLFSGGEAVFGITQEGGQSEQAGER